MPVSYSRLGELTIPVAMVIVLLMIIIPIPYQFVDFCLALNLTLSVCTLMATLYIKRPLEFSSFPSLLLVSTVFRLAINVAATRLILLNGFAGNLVEAFGEFVVGGEMAVGFAVFLIIVIVQYAVITRGAERVAEVAARFTLDALPGKQMSIDADLNAGVITEEQARVRRLEIQRQADFYGSMDGASKFTKGDAVAAMLVLAVNLLGGALMGATRGLDVAEAFRRYTLLTVGNGLLAQVPALIMSTASGIIVTRSAAEADLGHELTRQLAAQPRGFSTAGIVLAVLALVPGMPKLMLLVLSAGMIYLGARATRRHGAPAEEAKPSRSDSQPENVLPLVGVEPVELELGYSLIPLAAEGGDLLDRVGAVRRQLAADYGIVVPPIRIRDNIAELQPRSYSVKLRGVEIAKGELFPGMYLAMSPVENATIEGIKTKEPAFGLPAFWIDASLREKAEVDGWTVVAPSAVLATHLAELLKHNAHKLMTRQGTKELLDMVRARNAALVEELVPGLLSLGEVQKVLSNLLSEGIPIKDLDTILEAVADAARFTKDTDKLTQKARVALSATIIKLYGLDEADTLIAGVSPEVESAVVEALTKDDSGTVRIAMQPALLQALAQSASVLVERFAEKGKQPVLVCSGAVRPYLQRLLHKLGFKFAVLSYEELNGLSGLNPIGILTLHGTQEGKGGQGVNHETG
ncbi:MAG TPA: flagellar biosynthesis protein FlhA [Firmicutes bacterium]|nr:flagellar biosynthesis protein FlhA [Bacillota bacterium]